MEPGHQATRQKYLRDKHNLLVDFTADIKGYNTILESKVALATQIPVTKENIAQLKSSAATTTRNANLERTVHATNLTFRSETILHYSIDLGDPNILWRVEISDSRPGNIMYHYFFKQVHTMITNVLSNYTPMAKSE